MTPLAQDLFAQAREMPTAERDAFLQKACGYDAELRLEVQRLLVDAENADSFFGDENGATFGAGAFRDIAAMDLDATMGPAAGIPTEASPANPAAPVPFIFGRRSDSSRRPPCSRSSRIRTSCRSMISGTMKGASSITP